MTANDVLLLTRGLMPTSPRPRAPHLTLAIDLTSEPCLVVTEDGGEQRLTLAPAAGLPAARVTTLPMLPDVDLIALWTPWEEPVDLASLVRPGRRTLVVGALGHHAGRWCAGPLAHVAADGAVASYLPMGGPAALGIPYPFPETRGSPWEEALTCEGSRGDRALRALLAAVDAQLPKAAPALSLEAADFTPSTAMALALTRRARPRAELTLAAAAAALPPSWRRLCQNLDVRLTARRAELPIELKEIASWIPSDYADDLLGALNALSDVLPGVGVRHRR